MCHMVSHRHAMQALKKHNISSYQTSLYLVGPVAADAGRVGEPGRAM